MNTFTTTTTFTRTHARDIASRVATDLSLMHHYYGAPTLVEIEEYEAEFVELVVAGYLSRVEYGFKKNDERVVSVRYTVRAGSGEPERAGRVVGTADVSGASFFSFLSYSGEFLNLSDVERSNFKKALPFERSFGTEPGNGSGYWVSDRTYGAGGVSAARESFKRAA
jgi:HORMA domain-containing protein